MPGCFRNGGANEENTAVIKKKASKSCQPLFNFF